MKKTTTFVLLLCLAVPPGPSFAESKSPGKAALLSLILPGLGEWYAGGEKSAKFFLFTEGLFWTGRIAFRHLESVRIDTYESYAASHAGVLLGGKPESFIDELVQFQSIYDRNARERYIAGDLANLRPETPDQIWEWDSQDSRLRFRELRSLATSAEQKSFLFVGALVFNRFVSALNAARIAREMRQATSSALRFRLTPDPEIGARAWLRASF